MDIASTFFLIFFFLKPCYSSPNSIWSITVTARTFVTNLHAECLIEWQFCSSQHCLCFLSQTMVLLCFLFSNRPIAVAQFFGTVLLMLFRVYFLLYYTAALTFYTSSVHVINRVLFLSRTSLCMSSSSSSGLHSLHFVYRKASFWIQNCRSNNSTLWWNNIDSRNISKTWINVPKENGQK